MIWAPPSSAPRWPGLGSRPVRRRTCGAGSRSWPIRSATAYASSSSSAAATTRSRRAESAFKKAQVAAQTAGVVRGATMGRFGLLVLVLLTSMLTATGGHAHDVTAPDRMVQAFRDYCIDKDPDRIFTEVPKALGKWTLSSSDRWGDGTIDVYTL